MFGLAARTDACPDRDPRAQCRHHALARCRSQPRAQGIDRGRRRRHDVRPAHRQSCCARRVGTGIDARASRDAGSYLCNYLSWRAIEAVERQGRPAPRRLRPHPAAGARRRFAAQRHAHRITLEELVDAGEAMLLELVRLTRQAARIIRLGQCRTTLRSRSYRAVTYVALGPHRSTVNPTPNNRPLRLPRRPAPAAFLRYSTHANARVRAAGDCDHGRQSPPSHRSIRRRLCRRARDVARRRARRAADLGAWPRRHAIWRAARQPRRSDQRPAARDRRRRARADAAGAAAGGLPHRTAAPAERHAADRRARRDQADLHRRRLDVSGRRRRRHRPYQYHARRRRHSAAGAARPDPLSRRTRHPHHRLRDHRQRRQRHLVRAGLRRYQRQYHHQHRRHRDRVVRRAGPHRRRATPFRAPATTASRSCAPRSATTARWSPTTASRTSRPAPAAPANTATPSTPFAPAM